MRATRMLRLTAALLLAALFSTGLPIAAAAPAGAATPAQQCTRPPSNTPKGNGVARPGLNAHPTAQKITIEIKLLGCAPTAATGGGGMLTGTFKPSGPQTCALIRQPHALSGSGRIAWTNGKSSTLSLTFSLSGKSALANVTGKITAGLFGSHTLTGQFHFTADASHHDTTVAQACASKIAAGQPDRNSVVRLSFVRTKPFTIK
jgi:hypothetical protein